MLAVMQALHTRQLYTFLYIGYTTFMFIKLQNNVTLFSSKFTRQKHAKAKSDIQLHLYCSVTYFPQTNQICSGARVERLSKIVIPLK